MIGRRRPGRFCGERAGGAVLRLLACAMAVLLLAGARPAAAALTFPPLSGRVVDDAHILTAAQTSDLSSKLADLQARTSRQLVVVTLASLQGDEIQDYGYQLGRAWGIGQKTLNNGALFIVAPAEHQVRVEVGYGLEPVLTDALSSQILQERVLPRFRAGDLAGGTLAGAEALIDQLGADPSVAEQRLTQAAQAQAGGGNSDPHPLNLLGLIVPAIFLVIVLSGVLRGGGGGGGGGGGLMPLLFLGSLLGGGRGGDDEDGGGGGGGFSGGGGSFGGGGSSGSW